MKKPELLKLWIIAVRRENFAPTIHTVICSKHFTENDYLESSKNKNLLKKDAVPSIFCFKKITQPRRILKRVPIVKTEVVSIFLRVVVQS